MPVCIPPQFGISPRPVRRPAASQFLASTTSLALQITGPGRPSRLVRIRATKCTVGSAAGCTLRLRASGVDSLHCWILRGEAGTVIRRLNGTAALNGSHFDEALLTVGDRVNLGPVEIVVVECNAALPIEQIPVPATTRFEGEVWGLQTRLDQALEHINRLESESRQGFNSSITAAERADQLRDALAATNQQLVDLSSELTAAQDTIASQSRQLEAQTAKLDSLHAGEQSARETIQRLESQATAAAARCESLTSEWNDAQAAQTAERQCWTQERTQLAKRCEQLTAELQAVGGELNARSEAATIVFEQHALAGAVSDAKLNDLTEQLAAKQQEIDSLQRQLESQSVIGNRFEQLTRDYDYKCREVTELQARCDELSSHSAATHELEQRSQVLEQMRADLTSREASLADATRAFDEERAALAAKNQQLDATRDDLAAEQQRLADLRRELDQSQAGCANLDQRRAELDRRAEQLESRSTEVEAQAAAVASRTSELDSRQSQLDAQTGEVDSRSAQVESRAQEVGHWANEVAARATELDSRAGHLNARAAELESQAAEFTSRSITVQSQGPIVTMPFAAIESQSADYEAKAVELAARDAEVAGRAAELNQLLEQLVDQRAALAGREQELGERQNACESRLQQINEQALELAALRDELHARSQQLAEQEALARNNAAEAALRQAAQNRTIANVENPPAPAAGAENAPAAEANDEAEMNSVLSRLVQSGVWRQGQGPSEEAASAAQPAENAEAPAPTEEPREPSSDEPIRHATMVFEAPQRPQLPKPAAGDDEESIESYMDRLMQRVRGDGSSDRGSWKPSSSSKISAPAPTPAPGPTPAVNDSQSTEYSPRRSAPELSSNLSAMRDLANSAARTAIDQHVRLNTSRRAIQKLFGAFITICFSLVLAYWAWQIQSLQAAGGAGVGLLIGGYWTIGAFRRLSGLKRLDRETVKPATPAGPDAGMPSKTPTNGATSRGA